MNFKNIALLNKLNVLKQKLQTAQDFSEVFDYFLDELGENNRFIKMGRRARQEMIDAIIPAVSQQVGDPNLFTAQFLLLEIPDAKFFHGSARVGSRVYGVIYFKDPGQGMISICQLGSSRVDYVRFTTLPVDASKVHIQPNVRELNH